MMGATGTGKTSFINLVAGKDVGQVGEGLQYGSFNVPDIPGFAY